MEYRTLGRTGLDVSVISLGTEYLINIPQKNAVDVIHRAISQGVNYFDLFFAQPEFRDNMDAAFQGHRQKVILAAHLGAAIDSNGQYTRIRDPQQCEYFFLDFLARYHVESADILYLHNSDSQEDYDELMKPGGLLEMAKRFQAEGKTRFIGFSGHNTVTSRQAVESGQIDVLMFPVNFTNHVMPGRQALFDACVARQVGLVAMKPYAGGNLLREEREFEVNSFVSGSAQVANASVKFTKSATITPVQCLAYILEQTGVSCVVPGCANIEQLDAALAYLDASEQSKAYAALLPDFKQYKTGRCVHCNHCLPCPSNIDIGETLRLWQLAQQELSVEVRAAYRALPVNASDCIECGVCMERCPFGVDVIAQMKDASSLFA